MTTRLWIALNIFGRPFRLVPATGYGWHAGTGGFTVSWLGAQLLVFWGEAAQSCAETCEPMPAAWTRP